MRLIDADALRNVFDAMHAIQGGSHVDHLVLLGIKKHIEDAPTIDAEPVVRCKECKERCPESATSVQHCTLSGIQTEDDDFCSYGEKMDAKEENEK